MKDEPMAAAVELTTRDPMIDCLDEYVARIVLLKRQYELIAPLLPSKDYAMLMATWLQWKCDVTHARAIFHMRICLLYAAIKLVNIDLAPLAEIHPYIAGVAYNPIPPSGIVKPLLITENKDKVHQAKGLVLYRLRVVHRTVFFDYWPDVPGWHIAKNHVGDDAWNMDNGSGEQQHNNKVYPRGWTDVPWTVNVEQEIIVGKIRETAAVSHSVTFRPDFMTDATGTSATRVGIELDAVNTVDTRRHVYEISNYMSQKGPDGRNRIEVFDSFGNSIHHVYARVPVNGLMYGEQRHWTTLILKDAVAFHESDMFPIAPSPLPSIEYPGERFFLLPPGVGINVVNDNGAANIRQEAADIDAFNRHDKAKVVDPYPPVNTSNRYRTVTYDYDDDERAETAAEIETTRRFVEKQEKVVASTRRLSEDRLRGFDAEPPTAHALRIHAAFVAAGIAAQRRADDAKARMDALSPGWNTLDSGGAASADVGDRVIPRWRPGHIRR
jgi:hypothetical protein